MCWVDFCGPGDGSEVTDDEGRAATWSPPQKVSPRRGTTSCRGVIVGFRKWLSAAKEPRLRRQRKPWTISIGADPDLNTSSKVPKNSRAQLCMMPHKLRECAGLGARGKREALELLRRRELAHAHHTNFHCVDGNAMLAAWPRRHPYGSWFCRYGQCSCLVLDPAQYCARVGPLDDVPYDRHRDCDTGGRGGSHVETVAWTSSSRFRPT